MINVLFGSSFYVKYEVPNAKELISIMDEHSMIYEVDNDKFEWGKRCSVDKILLKWEEYMDLLKPSIELFANDLDTSIKYTMYNPWMNLYKRGDHQEVHEHSGNDISCVFFANSGEGFSEFYFKDRNSIFLTEKVKRLINYKNVYVPDVKEGDIIFFPSNLEHGVSPHNSDVTRRTLSVNLTLN